MALREWACIRSRTSQSPLMCRHKPLDRSQERLECIVGSTFLLLLFSFWENFRSGTLKILSRRKMLIRPKKGKTDFPREPINSQEA